MYGRAPYCCSDRVPQGFQNEVKYEWQAALGFTLKIKHLASGALKIKHLDRVGLIFLIAYVGLAQLVYVLNLCMLAHLFQERLPRESPAHTEMSVISMPSRTKSIWEFQLHTHHILYVCMYVCTCICMYVCIHICTRLGFVCPVHAHKACDTLPDGNYICSPKARRVVLKASSICGLHM